MTISIQLLAHASVQIKSESQNIYIDPTTKGTGLKKKDFAPADLILVTHGHQDHFDKALIKKIRKMGSPVIAPEILKDELKGGIVWGMSPGERMEISNGVVVWAVPAYNVKRFRESGEPFHPREIGLGYVIKVDEKRIYHAGDTDLIPEMEELPKLDVALLPSGGTYTMDMDEAAEAAILIQPKVAVPMHLRGADPQAFKKEVETKSPSKVVILAEGKQLELD
ncbi:MAG: MBL fold metallo-hydrolase [Candidatus Lokiarchaeota archaeon]|nr:MBL fold metallo-hydrolase [Candidatus Lokiarchaeota archaeon]